MQLRKQGRVVLVKPLGRWLDARGSSDVRRAVAGEVERGERFIVLDMGEVAYVDSSGVGTMVALLKLVPEGGKLVLCNCGPPLRQLLEKARLDHILTAFPTEAAAIASLSAV